MFPGGLVAVVTLVFTFVGLVFALSAQFGAAWIGSPIRPRTLYAIPAALLGFILSAVLL